MWCAWIAILERIDRAGAEDGTPQLLLTTATADAASQSWLFGTPDLPDDVCWPRLENGAPARFLAQIRLLAPPLPAVWHGRVVFLFVDQDEAVCVRTAGPVPSGHACDVVPGAKPQVLLGTLRLPRATEHDELGWTTPAHDPRFLLRRVEGLRALLPSLAKPERLLPFVLVPSRRGSGDVCLLGGEPELIQDEHLATCSRCRTSMRFLFQLGGVRELRGDGPTVYVYGCDEHPQEVQAFVDIS